MRKAVIIILAMVVALGTLPVTFACGGGWNWNWWWQPQKPVYCCPTYCNLTFISVETSDNEDIKDVAETTACISGCGKTLTITIDNDYPGYEGIVDFCIKNTGSMAATITGITPDISDPGYLQLALTGDCQVDTVIQPCSTKCGQLVIYGLPQEGTQNRTFTFEITIDYECTCTPPGNCETAYAYGGYCYAHCFLTDYLGQSFGNWGWTNGPLAPRYRAYVFDIYAGAAQCNLYKGKKVGWLTVYYDGSDALVTYNMFYGYKMDKTHLYVGSEPWPRKNGDYTVAPGQYPYSHDLNNASADWYRVEGLSGNIYIIAHAEVCR
jgi:hypothetical protein